MSLVRLSGSPFQRGFAQKCSGQESAQRVRDMVSLRLSEEADVLNSQLVKQFLKAQWDFSESYAKAHLDEVRGIAEGHGLFARDLFAFLHLGFLAPMRQALDGCSTLALSDSADGPMVAKNRDYRGEHQALQRLFHHTDPDRPDTSCLFVGSLGAPGAFSSGMNSHGLALADTRIDWPEPGVGWLRYFLMSEILWQAQDIPSAIALIEDAEHVGGGSLALADADGRVAMVELGSPGVAIETGGASYVHTNHYLAQDLADRVERLAGDVTSQSSRARLDTLRSAQAGFGPATTHKDIAALLSSHGPGNGRLCRHTGGGQDGTISGVVYLCGPREVVFSAGIPCSAGWQSFRL